jgi:hypothetical protein
MYDDDRDPKMGLVFSASTRMKSVIRVTQKMTRFPSGPTQILTRVKYPGGNRNPDWNIKFYNGEIRSTCL